MSDNCQRANNESPRSMIWGFFTSLGNMLWSRQDQETTDATLVAEVETPLLQERNSGDESTVAATQREARADGSNTDGPQVQRSTGTGLRSDETESEVTTPSSHEERGHDRGSQVGSSPDQDRHGDSELAQESSAVGPFSTASQVVVHEGLRSPRATTLDVGGTTIARLSAPRADSPPSQQELRRRRSSARRVPLASRRASTSPQLVAASSREGQAQPPIDEGPTPGPSHNGAVMLRRGRPLRRQGAFVEDSHPDIYWNSAWGARPETTPEALFGRGEHYSDEDSDSSDASDDSESDMGEPIFERIVDTSRLRREHSDWEAGIERPERQENMTFMSDDEVDVDPEMMDEEWAAAVPPRLRIRPGRKPTRMPSETSVMSPKAKGKRRREQSDEGDDDNDADHCASPSRSPKKRQRNDTKTASSSSQQKGKGKRKRDDIEDDNGDRDPSSSLPAARRLRRSQSLSYEGSNHTPAPAPRDTQENAPEPMPPNPVNSSDPTLTGGSQQSNASDANTLASTSSTRGPFSSSGVSDATSSRASPKKGSRRGTVEKTVRGSPKRSTRITHAR
ncbi:hypothetical protein CERSUDRAFT_115697 [Gelatoporia subvermispora B]|uniref:Uncharacterized protein n=1 Tax=Ceriporiopsis subvermispora (strain B) TaxID=914234 RepID=M2QUJ5_CERS8|nr:hypothetical protein CERSUDRAFT_115697 [Gelatoporia subvermispora B]